MQAIAVADLHGNILLYELLLRIAEAWKLTSIFIAGDLAPSPRQGASTEVTGADAGVSVQRAFFQKEFIPLLKSFLLDHRHVDVYAIMGNDDRRANEPLLASFAHETPNFHLVNNRLVEFRESRQRRAFFPGEVPLLFVAGYPYVPPGGELLMDWVKYENRVELRPEEMDPCADIYALGVTTSGNGKRSTIADDLRDLGGYLARGEEEKRPILYEPSQTVHLFHAPPYGTPLDWCAPRGRYEFLKLSDHVGSVEIRRFIARVQPYLVLSGHCHESPVMGGDYKVDLGRTRCVNPGSQTQIDVLSLVQFDVFAPQEMKQFFIHAR